MDTFYGKLESLVIFNLVSISSRGRISTLIRRQRRFEEKGRGLGKLSHTTCYSHLFPFPLHWTLSDHPSRHQPCLVVCSQTTGHYPHRDIERMERWREEHPDKQINSPGQPVAKALLFFSILLPSIYYRQRTWTASNYRDH